LGPGVGWPLQISKANLNRRVGQNRGHIRQRGKSNRNNFKTAFDVVRATQNNENSKFWLKNQLNSFFTAGPHPRRPARGLNQSQANGIRDSGFRTSAAAVAFV